MRFYLDNDVDVRCRQPFADAGHEVWTTADAGRYDAPDVDQVWYAAEKDAVLVTHDRGLTEAQKKRTVGRLLRLCCDQPDALELLQKSVDEIVPALASRTYVVVELRATGYEVFTNWT